MATVPQIADSYPSNLAQGIPIGDQIRVIFDQEMDLDTINTGTFVLSGSQEAPVFGPIDVTPFDEPGFEDEDILSSPYFKGYVKGNITFSKVDVSGGTVDDSVEDTTGLGNLWRTVAIFTPEKPLSPNVSYNVILLGDEAPTDNFDTGVKTRTVFDTVFTGNGSGRLTFNGGYTGDEELTYTVEITAGGNTGNAEYIWWKSTSPLTTYSGITSTGARELEDGIYLLCSNDGSFTIGDTFTVVVIPALVLVNNYRWSFTTGSGSILTPPSSSSVSGIIDIEDEESLRVVSIVPVHQKTNIDPDDFLTIIVTFNKALDPLTVVNNTVTLWAEPVNGDNSIQSSGILAKVLSIDGNVLTVQIPRLEE